MTNKKLYKATFNISGQPVHLHTSAINEFKAYHNFISQMSKKYNMPRHYFTSMFDGERDNYLIEET